MRRPRTLCLGAFKTRANSSFFYSTHTHTGSASIASTSGNLPLQDVLVCPEIAKSLMSVSKLTKDYPCSFEFDCDGVRINDKSTKKLLVTGNNNNGLYRIEDPGLKVLYSSRQCSATDEVWHMRLGHPQPEVLKLLSENKAISISRSLNKLCESCRLAKSTRLPFYDYVFVASKPLERYTVISGVRLLLYRFKVFNTMWCLLTTIQDSAGFIRLS